MKPKWTLIPGVLLLALVGAQAAPQLKVGDPAPPIKAAKWFKGQPVEKFDSNLVYVVLGVEREGAAQALRIAMVDSCECCGVCLNVWGDSAV